MGNINDKNAQDTRKADPRGVLLDPRGHFDPWTDKNEARAIEAVLYPGIDLHHPPSPATDHPRVDDRIYPPDVVRQSPSMLLDEEDESSSEDVFGTPLQANSFQPTDAEETEDVSLPLSDSIIPETFEAAENTEPFILPVTDPSVFTRTPASILHEVHSLETIEELNEDGALLNLDSDISDGESSLSSLGNPVVPLSFGHHNVQDLALPESAAAIIEQALENSPSVFASNNSYVTLEQNIDIPIASSRDPIPVLTLDEESGIVGSLSPLILAPPTLTSVNNVEERISVSDLQEAHTEINGQDVLHVLRVARELEVCCPDNRKSSVRFPEISAPESNSDAAPCAPHLKTISLPDFSVDESTALFASETPAHEVSGLGLIGPQVAHTIERESDRMTIATSISPRVPDAATECKEVLTLGVLPIYATRAVDDESTSSVLVKSSEPSLERETGRFITHLSIGIQASAVEDEINLVQAKINNLNLNPPDNDPPPPSPPSNSQHAPVSPQEKQTATPEPCSPKLTPAIPEIRTYADATNIAIQHPELAKEVLQMPLTSHHSSSTIDRFTRRIEEREGPEHTPDRPNWAKASDHGDVTAMSNPTSSGETLNRSIHTPSKPNWAAAPVLEFTPTPPKIGRSQRERNRRRRGRVTHAQGSNNNPESPQPTAGPSKQPEPAVASAVPGALKFEELRKPIPSSEIVPTKDQRKVAANRQKVSKWISDSSASVMGSPKSNTERGSIATPSHSVFLMDSVSDRVVNEGLDVNTNFGEEPLSPASRMAEALAARKALERGFNDNKLLENDEHLKTSALDPAPMTSIGGHPKASSLLLQGDRKVSVDKGKQHMVGSPSPVSRPRSASIASSIASGISARSGVSNSSRLFQRAIQEIGSNARPISHDDPCQIIVQSQDKRGRVTENAATQPPDPVSRKSPQMDGANPNAVTCPEILVTQESAEGVVWDVKGKVKASAPFHKPVEPVKATGSDNERFLFSFKPPQASIVGINDDQKTPRGYQGSASYATQLGAGAALPPPSQKAEHGGNIMKTPHVTSTRSFIPRGKYVPPPIRDGQMYRQAQVSTASPTSATAAPATAVTAITSRAPKNPQQLQSATNTAPASGTNMAFGNERTQSFDPPDDAFVKTHFQTPAPRIGTTDVRHNMPFGAAGGHVGAGPQNSITFARQPNVTATGGIGTGVTTTGANGLQHFQSQGAMTPLGFAGAAQQGFFDPQTRAQFQLQQAQIPQHRLNEYMANLAMAQERLQQNMVDLATLAVSGYAKPDAFNPTVTTTQYQNQNSGVRANRASVIPTTYEEARSYLQSPVCPQQSSILGQGSNFPPRLQIPTQFAAQDLFEEYCRRQRQEARTVYENNMQSALPRRRM